jgi:AcrR family transcriptional regulator
VKSSIDDGGIHLVMNTSRAVPSTVVTAPASSARRSAGRRRGESGTRQAIAAAARTLFATHGFTAVSVRTIAAQAGVDSSLVHHFFGTKRQLFDAVTRMPLDDTEAVAGMLEAGPDGLGERVARHVIDQLRAGDTGRTMVALVRTASSDPRAADLLRERYTRDLLEPVARGLDVDQPELRAALCCSQLLGLALTEHIIGLAPLRETPTEDLIAIYGAALQRYLTAPLPA